MPSSRVSPWPKDGTRVSYVSCIDRWVFYHWCHLGSPLCSFPPLLRKARMEGEKSQCPFHFSSFSGQLATKLYWFPDFWEFPPLPDRLRVGNALLGPRQCLMEKWLWPLGILEKATPSAAWMGYSVIPPCCFLFPLSTLYQVKPLFVPGSCIIPERLLIMAECKKCNQGWRFQMQKSGFCSQEPLPLCISAAYLSPSRSDLLCRKGS